MAQPAVRPVDRLGRRLAILFLPVLATLPNWLCFRQLLLFQPSLPLCPVLLCHCPAPLPPAILLVVPSIFSTSALDLPLFPLPDGARVVCLELFAESARLREALQREGFEPLAFDILPAACSWTFCKV